MTETIKNLSLRQFRLLVGSLKEPTQVSRRNLSNEIVILGVWYPAGSLPAEPPDTSLIGGFPVEGDLPGPEQGAAPEVPSAVLEAAEATTPIRLDIPIEEPREPDKRGIEERWNDLTGVKPPITTPEEAKAAVRVDPVRAVPKPSQRKPARKTTRKRT